MILGSLTGATGCAMHTIGITNNSNKGKRRGKPATVGTAQNVMLILERFTASSKSARWNRGAIGGTSSLDRLPSRRRSRAGRIFEARCNGLLVDTPRASQQRSRPAHLYPMKLRL